MSADQPTTGRSTFDGVFGETRWTLVLASHGDSPRAQQALSILERVFERTSPGSED